MKAQLWVQGMHGLGDNLHQRAVMRQLMKTRDITLETSWPSVYHDLVGDGLRLVRRPVALRTQSKNAARESSKFVPLHHAGQSTIRVRYGGVEVMQTPSKTVLEAMCRATGVDYATADYSLPVPESWSDGLDRLIGATSKPICVFRPLVMRPEWRGSGFRNADPAGYAALIARLRDEFFVVSVADLEPGREWITGPQLIPDVALHSGQLTFEQLAALTKQAALAFTSSGFMAILGPAVGTPTVSVIGGYESLGCHDSGARFAPYLAIGSIKQCACWTSQCRLNCDKTIDLAAALPRLTEFVSQNCIQIRDKPQRPMAEMFEPFQTPPTPAPATIPGRATIMGQRQAHYLMLQQQGLKA